MINELYISVIIPTFNRKLKVIEAIDSALNFSRCNIKYEIIVVDDYSEDGTVDFLSERYISEIFQGMVKIVSSTFNRGASGAKNLGAAHAQGKWLIFLDSDDLFITDNLHLLINELEKNNERYIVFFRSIDRERGTLIGPSKSNDYQLDVKGFISEGTPGECLPVVSNVAFNSYNYIASLRGGEGIAYANIIKVFGSATISTLILRKYDTSDFGRLSVGEGFDSRSCEIAKYHFFILTVFFNDISFRSKSKSIFSILYYLFKCFLWQVKKIF